MKYLSLIGDETVIYLQRVKVYVFSVILLCLGKIQQNPEANEAWRQRIDLITTDKSYRDYEGINREPTEFEWNIFPRFVTLQLCVEINDLLSRLEETFTKRILFMSSNEEECLAHARVVFLYARRFGTGQWTFIDPDSEKKCHSIKEDSPQGILENIKDNMLVEFAKKRTSYFPCYDSIVQRSTQKQRTWKTVDSLLCQFGND